MDKTLLHLHFLSDFKVLKYYSTEKLAYLQNKYLIYLTGKFLISQDNQNQYVSPQKRLKIAKEKKRRGTLLYQSH